MLQLLRRVVARPGLGPASRQRQSASPSWPDATGASTPFSQRSSVFIVAVLDGIGSPATNAMCLPSG